MDKRSLLTGIVLVTLLSGGGCGPSSPQGAATEKMPPLTVKPTPPQKKTVDAPPIVPAPGESTGAADQAYNPVGKPDPFQPTTVALEGKEKDRKKPLPLEQFEVNDFELVAIVSGPGGRRAMVQDVTGKGYFIQLGSRIGKKGGRVVHISDKEVLIAEPTQDVMGRKTTRTVKLKIPERSMIPSPAEKK